MDMMSDEQIGELWREVWTYSQEDAWADAVRDLIRKLVEERAARFDYPVEGVLDDFGIPKETWK